MKVLSLKIFQDSIFKPLILYSLHSTNILASLFMDYYIATQLLTSFCHLSINLIILYSLLVHLKYTEAMYMTMRLAFFSHQMLHGRLFISYHFYMNSMCKKECVLKIFFFFSPFPWNQTLRTCPSKVAIPILCTQFACGIEKIDLKRG